VRGGLPPETLAGSAVTVECELQYDRIAPSITNVRRQIDLK